MTGGDKNQRAVIREPQLIRLPRRAICIITSERLHNEVSRHSQAEHCMQNPVRDISIAIRSIPLFNGSLRDVGFEHPTEGVIEIQSPCSLLFNREKNRNNAELYAQYD
ncbi:hypothetical protein CDAR_29911 [Caerostris darwini]|uniref:Uncharacterized protein n=1 Tax=Caerostris darwini TaxID=1538125 RepID=A0AAV4UA74_9ARAC|nr:hypothetical protein CDAR_29911 [Caerostris darwini]